MFLNVEQLTSLDLSNCDISNSRYFESMFENCESLQYLKVGYNKPNTAVDMKKMF